MLALLLIHVNFYRLASDEDHLNIVSSSNGSWRSVWTMDFSYELQYVDIKGKIQVSFFN
jgi:hypothetical protein